MGLPVAEHVPPRKLKRDVRALDVAEVDHTHHASVADEHMSRCVVAVNQLRRITLDDTKLADALVQAGASELARKLDDKVGDRIGDRLDQIGDKLPTGIGDAIRDGAGGLLPRRRE
jgi:hypothetical protein